MAEAIEAFPLTWPAGVRRSSIRQIAPFTQTVSSSQEGLMRELRLMGARNIVISSDVGPRKADGSFYARAKMNPDDPGVAVYFDRKGQRMCFACDKWRGVHNNIHAIAKTVEALRGIERWGSAEMLDAAFTGFAALPSNAGGRSWWNILGVEMDASGTEVTSAYNRLVRRFGPDMPEEDHAKMVEINIARDEWRAQR